MNLESAYCATRFRGHLIERSGTACAGGGGGGGGGGGEGGRIGPAGVRSMSRWSAQLQRRLWLLASAQPQIARLHAGAEPHRAGREPQFARYAGWMQTRRSFCATPPRTITHGVPELQVEVQRRNLRRFVAIELLAALIHIRSSRGLPATA